MGRSGEVRSLGERWVGRRGVVIVKTVDVSGAGRVERVVGGGCAAGMRILEDR